MLGRILVSGLIFAGFFSASPLPVNADEYDFSSPRLMGLEYINIRDRTKLTTVILDDNGMFLSEHSGKPVDRIIIKPGTVVKQESRPGERTVSLFRGAGRERVLVCKIKVRYYRDSKETWVPEFRLYQEPVIVPKAGGGWKPIGSITGEAGGVVLTGNSLANAEGYYKSLEFSLGIGKTQIDSWQTQ
ncbi:MAG: hypothetical protein BMS9Abin33_0002 [Gammaproteobacteria bacterium]|nr:MAG: hypothetical protein BMS9Abin33_0002 [Gammaproteobacteria bacterium]